MSTKIMMMISSNKNPVNFVALHSDNSMMMPIKSNKSTVTKNISKNQALAMNLAQINKTKGCGCGGGK